MNDERFFPLLEQYARTRDTAVRDQLVEAYLPLCRAVAAKFIGRGTDREDLEQVAGIALMKALDRFDPDRGYRFVTYAVPTMTGDIRNYLRDKGGSVRMPRDARQRLYDLGRAQERFEREHLRTPSAMELAESLHITPDEMIDLMNLKAQTESVSLDAPRGEDGEGALDSFLGREDAAFDRLENSEWMRWVLSKLNAQEQQLVHFRFQDRLGQRETAKMLGVSQMQVSRMERRLLGRLRTILQSEA